MPKQYQGGLFSKPKFNATEDTYNDRKSSPLDAHGMTKGTKQFGIGLGLPSKFNRLYEGEEFKSLSKIMSEERLKGKASFITSHGFRHSSGYRTSSCAGDYSVTFQRKPYPYVAEMESRGPRSKIETFKSRPIYTAPAKRAVGAPFTTANIHFTKHIYESSPYDAAQQDEKRRIAEARKLTEGKPPFLSVSLGTDPLASPSKNIPLSPVSRANSRPGTANSTQGSRRKASSENDGTEPLKPFMPSKGLKSGAEYSVFSHYPLHASDPYNEKTIRGAANSDRLIPMCEQMEKLPEVLKERRPWSPSSPAKSMFTRTISIT
jgi:hypothetical protein